jgi:hypothetical protein
LEAEHEDFWYQKSPGGWRAKPTLEQALSLVDAGGAFSFVAISSPNKPLEVFDVYQQQDLPR